LKITLLGTGTSQGVPVIACQCDTCRSVDPRDKRLRSSVLVEEGDITIVIDTGPDFRQQMLTARVKKLDAILFTHEHRDHIAGLDDVRAFNFIMKKPMDVYAEERVIRSLDHEFPYIFAERKYPGIPQVNTHIIENQQFVVNDLIIKPIRVLHYRLPVLGYRIGDFAYITDANYIPPEEKQKLRDLKVLIICALRIKDHISHFTLPQALEVIDEVKPGQAYITHISHQLGLHNEIEKSLPDGINLSYDGLVLQI
jgi:phosphoribosyl 1,2-cyclic phosphate phosphodiesterase